MKKFVNKNPENVMARIDAVNSRAIHTMDSLGILLRKIQGMTPSYLSRSSPELVQPVLGRSMDSLGICCANPGNDNGGLFAVEAQKLVSVSLEGSVG